MNIKEVLSSLGCLSCVNRYSQSNLAKPENVLEHTGFVALVCLAICKELETQGASIDVGTVLEKALVHDMDEIITGDITRPVKYSSKEMLDLMETMSTFAINEISHNCGVDFQERWLSAKEGETGSIVELADVLGVLYKAYDEVVMRGNKTIQFGGCDRLRPLVRERIDNVEKIFSVDFSKEWLDISNMFGDISKAMRGV